MKLFEAFSWFDHSNRARFFDIIGYVITSHIESYRIPDAIIVVNIKVNRTGKLQR